MAEIIILKNAQIDGVITDVTVKNGKIESVGKSNGEGKIIDLEGALLFAGLVDIHTHGANGSDTMDSDIYELARYMKQRGTTSFLPTTMTDSIENLVRVTDVVLENNDEDRANIIGFHIEGPYISKKYKGAQNADHIKDPDIAEFSRLKNVKMITVAPELDVGIEFVRAVSEKGIVVSLGHTDADFEMADKALKSGACCLTHTFNAMPPLHHRQAGPVGAALVNNAYVQVICDGEHIHHSVVLALYRMFGADRMILISDGIRATGLSDGEYSFGNQKINVQNGIARTKNGNLAGSTATLFDCVKRAIEFGIPAADAFKMASHTPATLLNLKKGRIEAGYDAEFVVTDESYNLIETYNFK